MVLAATNRPWDLDEAIRRRLEKRIYIPLPTEGGRRELFKINLRGISMSENIDWEYLNKITEGYSGADISNVCREAAMMPMRKKLLSGAFDIANI
jgi:katanin p60 ATPase-containing subunit A1